MPKGKMRRRETGLATVAVLIGALFQTAAWAEPIAKERLTVVDGDSVAVDGVEWRLIGFDAPEIQRAKCEGERRVGILAQRRLAALIAGARQVEIVDSSRRDRYKRPLGDLLVDGSNVREVLIAELYARPYNGGMKNGWCSRDSRDDLIPGPQPVREQARVPGAGGN